MKIADHIIFVSKWLYDYYQQYNLKTEHNIDCPMSIIHNGVDTCVYYPKPYNNTIDNTIDNKIKIVTHHWSNNYLKGFEIYHYLDKYISEHPDCNMELIYIGNYNYEGYKPVATKIHPPMAPNEISNIIKFCDVYLTATQYEPGAMHYLEAMACGLPIVYRTNGGGAHEICNDCGIEFDKTEEVIDAIKKVTKDRSDYIKNIDYFYISKERCIEDFICIIDNL